MVAVLVSAAVVMPSPSGTSVAQASFAPVSLMDRAADALEHVRHGHVVGHGGSQDLSQFDTASGTDGNSAELNFAELSYDLNAVLQGHGEVPRISLASLPGDFVRIRETNQRKAQVNEQILHDRQRLRDLSAQITAGDKLQAVDRFWLAVMAERYGTRRGDVAALLKRHDVVPPSLALAQAATESAWGTSRFVREGNALFGQWTFAESHDGIVPNGRASGKTHRIRAFDSLYDSVASYVTNLNKHRAYKEYRAMRADMRAKGQTMDGMRLASTLHRYSERGAAYVDELYAIIGGNDLGLLDGARLSQADVIEPLI